MGKKEFSLYRSGNDNYHYLEDRNCEFINDYKISAGMDFYVPTPDIFPNPKDYFAIREENILTKDVINLINNPFRCNEDFVRVQRVNINSNDLAKDIIDTIVGNYQLCSNLYITQSSILAFRCVYRFINKIDNNGSIITPNDDVINGLIDFVFNRYANHIIVASTNKFTNTVHFLISNIISDEETINKYIEYWDMYHKTPKNKYNLLFTRNIADRFQSLQNDTERFLYFKPKI